MAKSSYATSTKQLFLSVGNPNATSNYTIVSEKKEVPQLQQVQVLMNIARMRRRSQRQLLVQLEKEQRKQLNVLVRTGQSLSSSLVGSSIEIPRCCTGITTVKVNDDDDQNSVSSWSNSLGYDSDNS